MLAVIPSIATTPANRPDRAPLAELTPASMYSTATTSPDGISISLPGRHQKVPAMYRYDCQRVTYRYGMCYPGSDQQHFRRPRDRYDAANQSSWIWLPFRSSPSANSQANAGGHSRQRDPGSKRLAAPSNLVGQIVPHHARSAAPRPGAYITSAASTNCIHQLLRQKAGPCERSTARWKGTSSSNLPPWGTGLTVMTADPPNAASRAYDGTADVTGNRT